jgi:hypothetical protein
MLVLAPPLSPSPFVALAVATSCLRTGEKLQVSRSDLVPEQLTLWQEEEEEMRIVDLLAVEEQRKILNIIKQQQEERRKEEELSLKLIDELSLERRKEEELSLKLIAELSLKLQQDLAGSPLQSGPGGLVRLAVPSDEEVAASLGIRDLGEQRRLWDEMQAGRTAWNKVILRKSHIKTVELLRRNQAKNSNPKMKEDTKRAKSSFSGCQMADYPLEDLNSGFIRCKVCEVTLNSGSQARSHLNGVKHRHQMDRTAGQKQERDG